MKSVFLYLRKIPIRTNGKNALLKQLIEKDKNEDKIEVNQHNQKTYAEVTTNKLASKNKRIPKIIVKNIKKVLKTHVNFQKKYVRF